MKRNPFSAQSALENSTLHWGRQGCLAAAEPKPIKRPEFLDEAHRAFRDLVLTPGFSCIGAKAAFHADAYGFASYACLGSDAATAGLSRDLCEFASSSVVEQSEYATFVAVFESPCDAGEAEFEKLLWQQLHRLHLEDRRYFRWDDSVSSDPTNSQFSFSFAERAFYVIGMHPGSSRNARRFAWPALVFNPHEQFERLRTDGKWKKMQSAIRARELVLQGNINPMLSDFGEQSEARQYSGRVVGKEWSPPVPGGGKCPFGHG